MARPTPSYGFDAPVLTRNALFGGGAALIVGTALAAVFGRTAVVASTVLTLVGVGLLAWGCSLIAYALRGKFTVRDRMLGLVTWRGDERVLDVGTGRGLLMIGAAKRLEAGAAVGLDVWRSFDLTGNTRESALGNAALEQVYTRVKVMDGDARAVPLPDATFDVVLSLGCLHAVPVADRVEACREIARLLKPGARAVIGDRLRPGPLAKAFAAAGCRVEPSRFHLRAALTPLWITVIRKI